MKISLRDIEVGDLNNVCIMILSKFARELHEHNGAVLKLQNPNVLMEAAHIAKTVNNPQLRILFERLKLELRTQLNADVPSHAEVGKLLVQEDLKSRVRKRMELRQEAHSSD